MGGLTSPKGGDTLSKVETQQLPAYAQAAQGNMLNAANAILGPYLQQQGFTTAPMNSDQTAAFDLTRQLAMGAFTNPAAANGNKAPTAPTLNPVSGTSYAMTPTQAKGYDAVGYDPRMATAAQVDGAQIQALLNPFVSSVVDTTNATINRNANQQQAQAAARSAAAGSFGGSRQAIQSAQISRAAGEQMASTTAQLMSAGWDKATATALANAQMRQQVELANQNADNTAGQFNAGAKNTASQFGASAYNAAQAADANAANRAAEFGAQLGYQAQNQNNANAMSVFSGDLNRFSTQAQIDAALKSSDYSRQIQAIQALLGVGNQQQQYYQGALDKPLTYLQLMGSLTPQNYGGTTIGSQPNTAASPLQNILGLGLSALATPLTGAGGASTLLGSLLKK